MAGVLQVGAVVVIVFGLTALLPGDTAVVVLGEQATPEQVTRVRAELGLDEPLGSRFAGWLGGLFTGDLGSSLLTGVPVADTLGPRLVVTAVLAAATLAVAVPAALAVGLVSGLRAGGRLDRALNQAGVLAQAVPDFALGLLLVALLSLQLGWLPATGAGSSGAALLAQPAVLVIPVLVLVVRQLAELARQVRVGVIDTNAAPFVAQVRRLGLPERQVLARHLLPAALVPSVQQLARGVDGLLGGVVVIEYLFALPGLGSGFVEAVAARDLPVVQAYAVLFGVTTVAVNLVADLAAHRLVPQRELLR
ncbi:ABC transporter permease [Pseudonocardia acidicola]|uniref:ABC transporter permease n=1 Tax=Pseudonocardia acidicola TaxID=2724939 RepID=UPI003B832D74